MPAQIWIALALLAIPFVFLALNMRKMFAEEQRRSRTPFTAKLLRPPGEGLRLRIAEIEDKMVDRLLIIAWFNVSDIWSRCYQP